ncbi:hypothetical protein ACFX15_040430 [Malus domestica]
MEKGNVVCARIYDENAIQKRTEQMNYLRLARGSTPWWCGLTPRPRCSPSTSQWAISSPYSCAIGKPFLSSRQTPPPSTRPHRRRFERAVTRSTTRSLSVHIRGPRGQRRQGVQVGPAVERMGSDDCHIVESRSPPQRMTQRRPRVFKSLILLKTRNMRESRKRSKRLSSIGE